MAVMEILATRYLRYLSLRYLLVGSKRFTLNYFSDKESNLIIIINIYNSNMVINKKCIGTQ